MIRIIERMAMVTISSMRVKPLRSDGFDDE
jgi:hypothetical protein